MKDGDELLHKDLTHKIIGCAFDVSNEVGLGLAEPVYKNSMRYAMEEVGLEVRREVPYRVFFRGHEVGLYRADIVVEDKVILELKVLKSLLPEHEAQLLNYMRISGIRVGLLINFGKETVEWKRFVL